MSPVRRPPPPPPPTLVPPPAKTRRATPLRVTVPEYRIHMQMLRDRMVPCVYPLVRRRILTPPDDQLLVSLTSVQQCCRWACSVQALSALVDGLPIQSLVANQLQMQALTEGGLPDPSKRMVKVR